MQFPFILTEEQIRTFFPIFAPANLNNTRFIPKHLVSGNIGNSMEHK
ncbi:hypothetical protein M079_4786 [Bacteroides fragilis str. 3996 N(B) 6]|nr:hypothetical protein M079_4786 [Bacteroides fragilis str. 3996 N(B) 6]